MIKKYRLLLLLIFLFLAWNITEALIVVTKNYHITSADLPKNFNNKKIAFITDLHCANSIIIKQVLKKIDQEKPDLIIFGGDYVDYTNSCLPRLTEAFKDIKAPLGVYGVLGNHDYYDHYSSVDGVKNFMNNSGIKPLDNQAYWLHAGCDMIKLGGVGDLFFNYQNPEPLINNLDSDDFSILVSHNPDYAQITDLSKIDLMLSGHTHGGQITFFGLWAPIIPSDYGQKYRQGLKLLEKTQLIISKGLGTAQLPFRFFSQPEFTIITLKKSDL